MEQTAPSRELLQVAERIRELRGIFGYSVDEMARKTDVMPEMYLNYETGAVDLPFTFIHKCALAFGVSLSDLLEGQSATLTGYTVTRRGAGRATASEDGISIQSLAPMFKDKMAEPYWVRYEYEEALQHTPIHTVTHSGPLRTRPSGPRGSPSPVFAATSARPSPSRS